MIEKLRLVLQQIIKYREISIQKYSKELEKQNDIEAALKLKAIEIQKKILILEIPNQSIFASIKTVGEFLNLWANGSDNPHTQACRRSFLNLVKQLHRKSGKKDIDEINFAIVGPENEPHLASNITTYLYKSLNLVKKTPNTGSEKSKNTYRYYIEKCIQNLESYLESIEKILWAPFDLDQPEFTSEALAKFLVFLEQKALKSRSINRFLDILICRTLIYAPLKGKELFTLNAPNKQNCSLNLGNQQFHVTPQFIALWECFNEPYLFPKSLRNCPDPESNLHTKIKRLSEAILPFRITPTMLRTVRKAYFPKQSYL